MSINIKRIYEPAEDKDGIRILVDRIWPRGISKNKAKLDYWLKGIAPSTALRKEFNHDPKHFPMFKQKYWEELQEGEQQEQLAKLKEIINEHPDITLLYAAKNEIYNQAVVLKELIESELG
ncbi:DUF488 domain-containing protein [Oceanobacillus salinisoli]|uniref:DUF488 domain-containing protein n=1 Tax=Oceanobacillus salinisoli TaxID=2678611 RepID=UPI0012E142B4|nr:DUF488 family protein [Oceanobacillus salinisoli]